MDYRKAVKTINTSPCASDLDELITTRDYKDIERVFQEMYGHCLELNGQHRKDNNKIEDNQHVLNVLLDHEEYLLTLLVGLKDRYYFTGLLSNLNTMDVFESLLRSSHFEYMDDEMYTQASDEESPIG